MSKCHSIKGSKIPLISNLKMPACASMHKTHELTILMKIWKKTHLILGYFSKIAGFLVLGSYEPLIFRFQWVHLMTLCNLVTVFVEAKSVTKSRLHSSYVVKEKCKKCVSWADHKLYLLKKMCLTLRKKRRLCAVCIWHTWKKWNLWGQHTS